MALVSEPSLVMLRQRLAADRAGGTPFEQAWEQARAELLADLTGCERKTWSAVLAATRSVWLAAYYGGSAGRVDCVTALEAFALDGEADALRYEPPFSSAASSG